MIMRFFSILLLLIPSLLVAQKKNSFNSTEQICRIGLQFQISRNIFWGNNKPVVLNVTPRGAAWKAGVRPMDIIESIQGINTESLSEADFIKILYRKNSDILLRIKSIQGVLRELVLRPECQSLSELKEFQLAEAFSFYSLEDETNRRLTYPFTTTSITNNLELKGAKFAFATSSIADKSVEDAIYNELKKELISLGFIYNESHPDLIFDTYYQITENSSYNKKDTKSMDLQTWRYDPVNETMIQTPFLPIGVPAQYAKYALLFGLRIISGIDLKTELWKCESHEYLSVPFSISKYANITIPIMLKQFPFIRYTNNPIFDIAIKRFFYTGLSYDNKDLSIISNIETNSPASKLSFRPGDKIISINGISFDKVDPSSLSIQYKEFIEKTLNFRNKKTSYTNSFGLTNCRYWNEDDYKKIARFTYSKSYASPFVYLFSFRPYMSLEEEPMKDISFQIERNGRLYNISVTPEISNETTISLK